MRVLRALNVDVAVSESIPEGRAALSQGMIATAKKCAERAVSRLQRYLDDGRDIVIVEPSSLAMFRRDCRHLLGDAGQFERFRTRTFDPVEYVARLLQQSGRHAKDFFDVVRSPVGAKLFFHAHCQQKTIGCVEPTTTLLRVIGFDIVTSTVECCGMAGSFGYKKDFYELSMAVAEDLFAQVRAADADGDGDGDGERVLVASGTSCREQLQAGLKRQVLHPAEVLAAVMRV